MRIIQENDSHIKKINNFEKGMKKYSENINIELTKINN
jgi:hypothetical protein